MGKRALTQGSPGAAKRRRETASVIGDEALPDAGIIKRIELKNFMNHASLSFDFQPRVNFVTGRNGTGKSALLTGLVVGLGGKAAATSRGTQISGFIQHGKNVSDIKIDLYNCGTEAYRPEVYGDAITVERKLIRTGGGDYKIKTSTGRVVSTKKADLTRILEHFNIQVENPVAILNQETSKNFLCSKNPTDVYKFFIRATQLEQMQMGYDLARKEFKSSMAILKSKESVLPTMEIELRHVQEKAAALESLDKLRTRLEKKQCQLAWAVVNRKEVELEGMEKRLRKLTKTLPTYEASVADSKQKEEDAKVKKREIEERIKEMAGDTETLEPQRKELKKELLAKRSVTRTHGESVKLIQQDLNQQEKDKKSMKERIDDIQASSQNDHTALVKERDEKLVKLNTKFQAVEAKCVNAKAQLNTTLRSLTSLREEKNEHASSVGECERLKKHHQQKKAQLEKSRSNKSMRFGRYMPALLEELDKLYKDRKFTKKPIGPLGAHISIKDMKYALGAERALGAIMSAFYVNDKRDAVLLNQVKKRVCAAHDRYPDVFTGRFTEHRYSAVQRDKADTSHPTLMDLLIIDNNCVFNCLIDQISMHNIVMVLNPAEARKLMFRNKPRNSTVCYDGKGDEIRTNPDRAFGNNNQRPNFFSASVEEDIKAEAVQLREVSETFSKAQRKLEQVTLQIQANHESHQKMKAEVNSMERQLRKFQSEIEELNGQVIEEEAVGDVEALTSDVLNLEGEIEQLRSNLHNAREKYNSCKGEEKRIENQLADVSSRIREMNSSIDPLRGELNAADDLIDDASRDTAHYQGELKKFNDRLQKEELELERFKESQVQKDTEIASQMSQRMQVKKGPESLEAEIKKIKAQLSKEEELRGDADEIRELLNTLTEKYNNAKKQLRQCQLYRKEMQASLITRRKNMFEITQGTAQHIKIFFATYLHQRNYDGKLYFDFDDCTLDIKVYPDSAAKTSGSANTKDLRGLSGGEKSFSTLCFVMALWDAVASPFRCMDEFDVFMDMVNRRVSIKMLLEFSKNKPSTQFLFLTPQDTSQIEVNNFVHIYRMPDPKRGEDGESASRS